MDKCSDENGCAIIAQPDVAATLRYLEAQRKPRRAAAMAQNRDLIEHLSHRIQLVAHLVADYKVWDEDDIPNVLGWLRRGQGAIEELIEILNG